MEFGTGALKITSCTYDTNDYEIGQKHNLQQMIDALDDDGKLNEHGLHYNGKIDSRLENWLVKRIRRKNLCKSRRLCE